MGFVSVIAKYDMIKRDYTYLLHILHIWHYT